MQVAAEEWPLNGSDQQHQHRSTKHCGGREITAPDAPQQKAARVPSAMAQVWESPADTAAQPEVTPGVEATGAGIVESVVSPRAMPSRPA